MFVNYIVHYYMLNVLCPFTILKFLDTVYSYILQLDLLKNKITVKTCL